MIDSVEQAIRVQTRRRNAGLKGRSKAVRRWFKRQGWRAIEAYSGHPPGLPMHWREQLGGDFSGCRGFSEVHDPQIINRAERRIT